MANLKAQDIAEDVIDDRKMYLPIGSSGGQQLKSHEVYQNTQYIPNTVLRLLHVEMNGSITF